MQTVKNNTVTVNYMEKCTLGGRYTHYYYYCRYKQMIILKIHYFGPRDSPQVGYLLDAWEGDSACVD